MIGAPLVGAAAGAAAAFYGLRSSIPASDLSGRPSLILVACLLCAAVLISSTALVVFFSGGRMARRWASFTIAFSIGVAIGISAADRPPRAAFWGMRAERVREATVRVASDPRRIKGGGQLAEVDPLSASGTGGLKTSASGRIAAIFPSDSRGTVPAAERGSVVTVSGQVVEGRFGPLLKVQSYAVAAKPSAVDSLRLTIRKAVLDRLDGRSWGGLAAALLLGSKDGLDAGENEAYTAAGCAHVLALSGMHLALLSALLAFFLKPLLGLKPATVVGFASIAAYVYIAGAQPSLVRAALMYAVAAVGIVYNFPRNVLCLLSAGFMIQLAFDPESARGMSFILSYLALAGLVLFAEPADDLARAWIPDFLRPALAASLGAFLATATVSASVFGTLRPIGLVASLALTPAANVIMVGAMAYIALTLIHPALGVPIDAVLSVLGKANDAVVAGAAGAGAIRTESALPVLVISLAVGFLLVYGRFLRNETRNRFDPIR